MSIVDVSLGRGDAGDILDGEHNLWRVGAADGYATFGDR
jgi:hypothetical protein